MAEKMMGSMDKEVSEAVKDMRIKYLRSIVATKSIMAGERFSYENIGIKRNLPNNLGLAPKYFESIIGKIATTDIRVNQSISKTDIKHGRDLIMEVL